MNISPALASALQAEAVRTRLTAARTAHLAASMASFSIAGPEFAPVAYRSRIAHLRAVLTPRHSRANTVGCAVGCEA